MAEVAPFGIQATIVEPGVGRTSIFEAGRLVKAPELDAYTSSPARLRTKSLESGGYVPPGDPFKMMQAVIDSVDLVEAPGRLVLGSDAYHGIRAVLTQRLAALEAQKEVAFSTDADHSLGVCNSAFTPTRSRPIGSLWSFQKICVFYDTAGIVYT